MLLAQTETTYYYYSSGDAAAATGIGIGLLIFWLLSLALGLVGLIWIIICILDVNKHSDAAWAASGQNKQTWLILNIVGIFICPILIAAIYWFSIKPKVVAAEGGGAVAG